MSANITSIDSKFFHTPQIEMSPADQKVLSLMSSNNLNNYTLLLTKIPSSFKVQGLYASYKPGIDGTLTVSFTVKMYIDGINKADILTGFSNQGYYESEENSELISNTLLTYNANRFLNQIIQKDYFVADMTIVTDDSWMLSSLINFRVITPSGEMYCSYRFAPYSSIRPFFPELMEIPDHTFRDLANLLSFQPSSTGYTGERTFFLAKVAPFPYILNIQTPIQVSHGSTPQQQTASITIEEASAKTSSSQTEPLINPVKTTPIVNKVKVKKPKIKRIAPAGTLAPEKNTTPSFQNQSQNPFAVLEDPLNDDSNLNLSDEIEVTARNQKKKKRKKKPQELKVDAGLYTSSTTLIPYVKRCEYCHVTALKQQTTHGFGMRTFKQKAMGWLSQGQVSSPLYKVVYLYNECDLLDCRIRRALRPTRDLDSRDEAFAWMDNEMTEIFDHYEKWKMWPKYPLKIFRHALINEKSSDSLFEDHILDTSQYIAESLVKICEQFDGDEIIEMYQQLSEGIAAERLTYLNSIFLDRLKSLKIPKEPQSIQQLQHITNATLPYLYRTCAFYSKFFRSETLKVIYSALNTKLHMSTLIIEKLLKTFFKDKRKEAWNLIKASGYMTPYNSWRVRVLISYTDFNVPSESEYLRKNLMDFFIPNSISNLLNYFPDDFLRMANDLLTIAQKSSGHGITLLNTFLNDTIICAILIENLIHTQQTPQIILGKNDKVYQLHGPSKSNYIFKFNLFTDNFLKEKVKPLDLKYYMKFVANLIGKLQKEVTSEILKDKDKYESRLFLTFGKMLDCIKEAHFSDPNAQKKVYDLFTAFFSRNSLAHLFVDEKRIKSLVERAASLKVVYADLPEVKE